MFSDRWYVCSTCATRSARNCDQWKPTRLVRLVLCVDTGIGIALESHSHRIASQRIASRRLASFIEMTNSQIISQIFRYIWIRSMQMRTRICGL